MVEYLAELTDRKIQIIESERELNKHNQSKLILHYSSVYHFTNETPEIKKTILDIVRRGKKLDVLTYSKKLAKAIISDPEINKKLTEKFGAINDCTSENIDNQRPENKPPENRFDNSKCNIGTNFKSGVSIQKENHALVIVLPPRSTMGTFKNKFGIFSGGITSIIQGLARKRKSGEIHIILPRPDEFKFDSLRPFFSDEQLGNFKSWYNKVQNHNLEIKDKDKVNYLPLNLQSWFLNEFYAEELKKSLTGAIQSAKQIERGDLARLDFPPYKNYVLSKGEDYLAQKFKFWGGDLSAYLTYCAFTNQFVNCTLSDINSKTILVFNEGEIQKGFDKYGKIYFNDEYMESLLGFSNFFQAYINFRNKIFGEFTLKYKKLGKEDLETITSYNNSKFEKQLLRYVAYQYYGKTYQDQFFNENRLNDVEYSRSQYFLDAMSCSKNLDANNPNYTEAQREKILAFQNLNYFREILNGKIRSYSWGNNNFNYLTVKPVAGFVTIENQEKFNQVTRYLRISDEFVKNGIFEFMRDFSKMSQEQKINSFYTILVEDFYKIQKVRRITIATNRTDVKPVDSIIELPDSNKTINLINPPDYNYPEGYIDELTNFAISEYGSLENYYKSISDIINK